MVLGWVIEFSLGLVYMAQGLDQLLVTGRVDPVQVTGPVVGFWAGLVGLCSRASMKLDPPFDSKIIPN